MGSSSVKADTFTGSGSLTTDTFESVKYTKIDWSTVASNEFNIFSVFVYEQGDVLLTDAFGEALGTTYLYESGTFYLDVTAANLDSWSITTTPTNGEYLSDGDTITGIGNTNSKLFNCHGDCSISWEGVATNEFDIFSVFIYEVGNILMTSTFSELTGTTNLFEDGTFYFDITAANLDSWSITVTLDEAATTQDPTATDGTPEGENTTDTEEAPLIGWSIGIITLTVFIYRYRKSNFS